MKRHLTKITAIALFLGLGGLGLLMGAQVIAAHYDYNTDILGKALLQVGSLTHALKVVRGPLYG